MSMNLPQQENEIADYSAKIQRIAEEKVKPFSGKVKDMFESLSEKLGNDNVKCGLLAGGAATTLLSVVAWTAAAGAGAAAGVVAWPIAIAGAAAISTAALGKPLSKSIASIAGWFERSAQQDNAPKLAASFQAAMDQVAGNLDPAMQRAIAKSSIPQMIENFKNKVADREPGLYEYLSPKAENAVNTLGEKLNSLPTMKMR